MTVNLITGVGGFVASHLADYLLEKGEQVVGTYRWNEDLSRIKHIKDKITMIPADLNDMSSLLKALETKPDYIYHLAAESYVNDSFDRPIETMRTNAVGTTNLLEAIRLTIDQSKTCQACEGYGSWDPKIHVCSSSEYYGQVTEEDIPINELCQPRPANPYAASKVAADMIAYVYFKYYGLKIIRTRMFTHTGPRRTMMSAECAFAKQIAEFEKELHEFVKDDSKELRKEFILKHGNLDSVRTFADVRDAVKAYYLLLHNCTPGEVYNIGGETEMKIETMLKTLIDMSPIGDKIKLEQDPKLLRKADVTLQIPDCTKFKKESGWEPEIPFDKTMEDLLDFWRQNV